MALGFYQNMNYEQNRPVLLKGGMSQAHTLNLLLYIKLTWI